MSVVENLAQHWETAWKQVREVAVDTVRREELHPSSFPYCGYRHAMEQLEHGDSDVGENGAMMLYYVNVGSAAHLVFQEFMGKLKKKHGVEGRIIGDWKCTNPDCGHLHEFDVYKLCPKCKSDTTYEELGVRYRKRTKGHTDGLYLLDGKYWVIDYKTSSIRAIEYYQKTGRGFPYTSNKFQIRSYIAYLEEKYEIEIEGWALIYAARDNPSTHYAIVASEMSEDDRKWVARYVKISDEMFHIVRDRITTLTIEDSDITNLCKYKLCSSSDFYEENVYDKYDPCPYSSKCFTKPEYFLRRSIKNAG